MQGRQSARGGVPRRPDPVRVRTVTLDRDEVRRDRLLKNEQVFRDYNNRRVAFEQDADAIDELVPFVCECGDPECIEGDGDDGRRFHGGPLGARTGSP